MTQGILLKKKLAAWKADLEWAVEADLQEHKDGHQEKKYFSGEKQPKLYPTRFEPPQHWAPATSRVVKKQKTTGGDDFVEINKTMVEVEAEKLEVQKQILEELRGINASVTENLEHTLLKDHLITTTLHVEA